MKPFSGTSDSHRDCWALLPWFANERLSAIDTRRVDEHLRDCELCRAELALQRRLREAIRAEDAVVLAPQRSFQKLMQRIDDEGEQQDDERHEQSHPAVSRAPTSRFARVPRWFAVAAGFQAIVIAALIATLWSQSQELLTAPRFATLTSPSSVAQGPVIRVVFESRVTVDEINELLRSIEAHIVAGPSEAGVYTLQLVAEAPSTRQVEQIAAELRIDSRIIFSEPAVAEITGK